MLVAGQIEGNLTRQSVSRPRYETGTGRLRVKNMGAGRNVPSQCWSEVETYVLVLYTSSVCCMWIHLDAYFALNTTWTNTAMQRALQVFRSLTYHIWQTREFCKRTKIHRLTAVVSGHPLISFLNSAASLTYVFHCFTLISFTISTRVQRTDKVHNSTHGNREKGDWPFKDEWHELLPHSNHTTQSTHSISVIKIIQLLVTRWNGLSFSGNQ